MNQNVNKNERVECANCTLQLAELADRQFQAGRKSDKLADIIAIMATQARWYINITKWKPTKDEWLALTSGIAREELERINKFQFQEDSKSSLIGCALIRKFLTQVTGTPTNQLILTRNQYGRPEICKEYRAAQTHWPCQIDFNVSHSGDYCVLAGASSHDRQMGVKVGVDVTKIVNKSEGELARFLDLMKRREFTRGEWETVERADGDRQKCINFTRLWCLKESYIKAIGLGLSFKLNRIDFRFADERKYHIPMTALKSGLLSDASVSLDGQAANDWQFYLTALDDEHIVALAHKFETALRFTLDPQNLFEEMPVRSVIDSLESMAEPDEDDWRLFSGRGVKTRRGPAASM